MFEVYNRKLTNQQTFEFVTVKTIYKLHKTDAVPLTGFDK